MGCINIWLHSCSKKWSHQSYERKCPSYNARGKLNLFCGMGSTIWNFEFYKWKFNYMWNKLIKKVHLHYNKTKLRVHSLFNKIKEPTIKLLFVHFYVVSFLITISEGNLWHYIIFLVSLPSLRLIIYLFKLRCESYRTQQNNYLQHT